MLNLKHCSVVFKTSQSLLTTKSIANSSWRHWKIGHIKIIKLCVIPMIIVSQHNTALWQNMLEINGNYYSRSRHILGHMSLLGLARKPTSPKGELSLTRIQIRTDHTGWTEALRYTKFLRYVCLVTLHNSYPIDVCMSWGTDMAKGPLTTTHPGVTWREYVALMTRQPFHDEIWMRAR